MNLLQKNKEQYYPVLVSKLIHERYSPDAETALINNYLANPETYGEEYRAYQAFRLECKEKARRITNG